MLEWLQDRIILQIREMGEGDVYFLQQIYKIIMRHQKKKL